jgi:hypothetical protein
MVQQPIAHATPEPVHSILEGVRPEDVRLQPFPHVILRPALPEAYYRRLAASYPSLESVAGPGELPSNKAYRLSAADVVDNPSIDPLWREFFAYHCSARFFDEFRALFAGVVDRVYPSIAAEFGKPLERFRSEVRTPGAHNQDDNYETDITLDCQFAMNSPVHTVSSVRGPHVDRGLKLFAATLYFRVPGDPSTGADLDIYRYKDERHRFDPERPIDPHFVKGTAYPDLDAIDWDRVERVDTIPYGENVGILWLNTPYSLHGVTPRSVTDVPRRYVNFLGECFSGPKHGFFYYKPEKPIWKRALKRTKRVARRLLRPRQSART